MHELLGQQHIRDALHDMGSSSKLRLIPEVTMTGVVLQDNAPNAQLPRIILCRIEDTEIEPGKPNVVGFLGIHDPNLDMSEIVRALSGVAEGCSHQGRLARPGMALLLGVCGVKVCIGMYGRRAIKDDGGQSGCSDNSGDSVSEEIKE